MSQKEDQDRSCDEKSPKMSGWEVPAAHVGLYHRAKASKAAALKLKCLECVGFVKADVRNCTGRDCPLWPHRPYQRPG